MLNSNEFQKIINAGVPGEGMDLGFPFDHTKFNAGKVAQVEFLIIKLKIENKIITL